MADRVYTAAEIDESQRKARMAFYRMRSESLRRNTTTEGGVLSTPAQKPAALSKRPRRNGILGYIADAYQDATNQ